jgi:nucleotide-binding universal stress UspA family protein
MQGIRTILFPADFSECSSAAFEAALGLAQRYNARLVVLHVDTPPPFTGPGPELGRRLRRRYPAPPPLEAEYHVVLGDPALAILQEARRIGCDLLVIGTHGRSGWERLMGSVAEEVLRRAPCPVLTAKVPAPSVRPVESESVVGGGP